MFSIAHLLDAAREKGNIVSDYQLAKVIGITHQAMSAYRAGKTLPNTQVIAQLCALSGDDAGVIAAQVEAARAKEGPVRVMWLSVAARLAGRAQPAILAALFAIALIAGYASPARAGELASIQKPQLSSVYIVSSGRFGRVADFLLVRLRRLAVLFGLCTWAAV